MWPFSRAHFVCFLILQKKTSIQFCDLKSKKKHYRSWACWEILPAMKMRNWSTYIIKFDFVIWNVKKKVFLFFGLLKIWYIDYFVWFINFGTISPTLEVDVISFKLFRTFFLPFLCSIVDWIPTCKILPNFSLKLSAYLLLYFFTLFTCR